MGKKISVAPLFYFGTLLSSVGSFVFNIALIAFMLQSGFNLAQASIIIGLQRLVPAVIAGVWGHFTDTWPATLTVAVIEGIAALASVLLFWIWAGNSTNYVALAVICVARSALISFQTGSRAKITKFLSDDTYAENSRQAIWLNKATQGATLFSGLLGWIIVKHFNFETAVVFDGITFLLSGLVALAIPYVESRPPRCLGRPAWYRKFTDLFQFNQRPAVFDLVLLIPMMGTVAYMSRLAGSDQSWTGLFMASYGLAVWVSGSLERRWALHISCSACWIILGISFFLLGQFKGPSVLALAVFFVKDVSFWIIFHRISSHIQMDTPSDRVGGVISARACIMTLILTSGEALVGAWSNILSVSAESIFRGTIALLGGVFLFFLNFKPRPILRNRPSL